MIPLRDNIPSRRVPFVNYAIITLCSLVYIFQFLLSRNMFIEFIYQYGFIPAQARSYIDFTGPVIDRRIYTIFTSTFLHGSWFHLISNMWFLWIFGDNVEDRMGHFWYLVFYLFCGVTANLVHMMFNPASLIPAVGASGAIAGIMGAYYRQFPEARIKTLIPLFVFIPLFVNIPASLFIIIWFITQVYSGAVYSLGGGSSVGGVAWWAHVGGFLAGLIIHYLFIKKVRYQRYFM